MCGCTGFGGGNRASSGSGVLGQPAWTPGIYRQCDSVCPVLSVSSTRERERARDRETQTHSEREKGGKGGRGERIHRKRDGC